MAFFDQFLTTIFGFLLSWNPLYAIISISFLISLVIVITYKFLTDQTEMKRLKETLKDHQKRMRDHKNDTQKMLSIQKEAMQTNMQYMAKSIKPTLITFLPILLIFGWLNGHFSYEPLMPNTPFNLTVEMKKGINGNVSIATPEGLQIIGPKNKQLENGKTTFELSGEAGEYLAALTFQNQTVDKHIILTTERKYAEITQSYEGETFKQATLGNKPLTLIHVFGFGLTWLWAYIISAILFSITLRTILRVH